MKFVRKSLKKDPVVTYVSEDGFYQIVKRPAGRWTLLRVSLFNIMGETVGQFDTLEDVLEYFA